MGVLTAVVHASQQVRVARRGALDRLFFWEAVFSKKKQKKKTNKHNNHSGRKSLKTPCLQVLAPEDCGRGFCEVGALNEAKDTLREAVQLPLKHPELFTGGALARYVAGAGLGWRNVVAICLEINSWAGWGHLLRPEQPTSALSSRWPKSSLQPLSLLAGPARACCCSAPLAPARHWWRAPLPRSAAPLSWPSTPRREWGKASYTAPTVSFAGNACTAISTAAGTSCRVTGSLPGCRTHPCHPLPSSHTHRLASKWFGDSLKYTRAAFSLAAKLAPCVLFIDEVDALLGRRNSQKEHEAMRWVAGAEERGLFGGGQGRARVRCVRSCWCGILCALASGAGRQGPCWRAASHAGR